jgi:predicted transcriptional regulator
MTIIKNHFEVFLVTSKKQGNGIFKLSAGIVSKKKTIKLELHRISQN